MASLEQAIRKLREDLDRERRRRDQTDEELRVRIRLLTEYLREAPEETRTKTLPPAPAAPQPADAGQPDLPKVWRLLEQILARELEALAARLAAERSTPASEQPSSGQEEDPLPETWGGALADLAADMAQILNLLRSASLIDERAVQSLQEAWQQLRSAVDKRNSGAARLPSSPPPSLPVLPPPDLADQIVFDPVARRVVAADRLVHWQSEINRLLEEFERTAGEEGRPQSQAAPRRRQIEQRIRQLRVAICQVRKKLTEHRNGVSQEVRLGLARVEQTVLELLKTLGLSEQPIKIGVDRWEPGLHKVIEERPTAQFETGVIVEITQHGYLRDGKLDQPAHVIVSKLEVPGVQRHERSTTV